MNLGITIREDIGIGDKVQFSSLPENYFHTYGEKLIDVSKSWIFDHNPFVVRGVNPDKTIELWNWPKTYEWPKPKRDLKSVYQTNAEIWANLFGIRPVLIRPRLYVYEEGLFAYRRRILFHPFGRSHGTLPDQVIDHVIKKYRHTGTLYQIGLPTDPDLGIPKLVTPTYWDLANAISKCQLFIGVDSGPAWVAACYPDVVVKKVRNRLVHGEVPYQEWVPLAVDNIHSHWDDRIFQVFHTGENDMSYMQSYRKL
jgi:hypothetical protein